MSCSLLTPWFYSLNYLSCGNVICGISCLYFFSCISCEHFICGTTTICLTAYTTISSTLTSIGNVDGSTLPLIIFCAFKFVLSCSLFIPKDDALPSSTLFFLLKTLLGDFVATFFLFSNATCISFLVLLTLACGFNGFSFC